MSAIQNRLQPQGLLQINRSNPRTHGLIVATAPAVSLKNIVTNTLPTITGTAPVGNQVTSDLYGKGLTFHLSGGTNGYGAARYGPETLGTSNDFTFIWVGRPENFTTANGFIMNRGGDGFGAGWNMSLAFEGGAAGSDGFATTTNLLGYYIDSSPAMFSTFINSIPVVVGRHERIAFVKKGASFTVYNWRTRGIGANTAGNGALRTSTKGIGLNLNTSDGPAGNSKPNTVLAYNIGLSTADVWSLLDNPWQIFVDQTENFTLPASAVTNTNIVPGVGSVVITGYAPTVTQPKTVVLTSGTTWTVPADFDPANNTVETWGGGGGGSTGGTAQNGAGGGGAWNKAVNVNVSGTVTINIGTGGSPGTAGGDTWFNGASLATSSVGSKGGNGTVTGTGGLGGSGAAGVGSSSFDGGKGGNGTASGGGGGGGSGGKDGLGANGAPDSLANGGNGGNGDAGSGGAGGSGGATGVNGGPGTANTEGGGGGGGAGNAAIGGNGGLPGGGGGAKGALGTSGTGGGGQIRIIYVATASSGTNITPDTGNLTLTGYAPTLAQTANQSISPTTGNIVLSGYAPTVSQTSNQTIAPGTGILSLVGYAPTITQSGTTPAIVGGHFGLSKKELAKRDQAERAALERKLADKKMLLAQIQQAFAEADGSTIPAEEPTPAPKTPVKPVKTFTIDNFQQELVRLDQAISANQLKLSQVIARNKAITEQELADDEAAAYLLLH